MNCDVCIGGDVGDCDGYAEFYSSKEVKARKPHKCLECKQIIQVGELYQRASGKFDGRVFADKTCLPCAEIRSAYSCGEVEPVGELWSMMREVFDDLRMAGECWDSLSAAGKGKLLGRWRAWKGLHDQ